MMLHCNIVSHWLGAYTKWSLFLDVFWFLITMSVFDWAVFGESVSYGGGFAVFLCQHKWPETGTSRWEWSRWGRRELRCWITRGSHYVLTIAETLNLRFLVWLLLWWLHIDGLAQELKTTVTPLLMQWSYCSLQLLPSCPPSCTKPSIWGFHSVCHAALGHKSYTGHQLSSALLILCEGTTPVTGRFPSEEGQ